MFYGREVAVCCEITNKYSVGRMYNSLSVKPVGATRRHLALKG